MVSVADSLTDALKAAIGAVERDHGNLTEVFLPPVEAHGKKEAIVADLRAVPDRPEPDVYGHVEFWDGVETHKLSIGVYLGGDPSKYTEDVLLDPHGWVLRHRWDRDRMSTEEERAAVGWTW